MKEFISAKIKHSILDQTPVIFGSVKEGILEILDERLGAFRDEMVATLGVPLWPDVYGSLRSLGRRVQLLALVVRDWRWVMHLVFIKIHYRIGSLWRFREPYARSYPTLLSVLLIG